MSQEECLKILIKNKKPMTISEVASLTNQSITRANHNLNSLCKHPFPRANKIFLKNVKGNNLSRIMFIAL